MPEFILDKGTLEAARVFQHLDAFTQGYIEAAFFTETGYLENGDLEDATFADLALSAVCKYQSVDLYRGDDGKVYV